MKKRQLEIDTGTVDELVKTFWEGEAPKVFNEDTVREAMARQIVQCHGVIRMQLDCVTQGDESALYRVESLASLIFRMMDKVMPEAPPVPQVKRHELRIAVERRGPEAPRPASPAPAIGKPASAILHWPREAYLDGDGVFHVDLYDVMQQDAAEIGSVAALNELRAMFGLPPFLGTPLPPAGPKS